MYSFIILKGIKVIWYKRSLIFPPTQNICFVLSIQFWSNTLYVKQVLFLRCLNKKGKSKYCFLSFFAIHANLICLWFEIYCVLWNISYCQLLFDAYGFSPCSILICDASCISWLKHYSTIDAYRSINII